jgi:hypothetical protein
MTKAYAGSKRRRCKIASPASITRYSARGWSASSLRLAATAASSGARSSAGKNRRSGDEVLEHGAVQPSDVREPVIEEPGG